MCNVANLAKTVATNTKAVVIVALPRPQSLAENKSRLQAIVSGAASAKPVVFTCGCRIEQWKSGKAAPGVKLIQPNGPTIALKGTTDFADFVKGAQSAGAELNDEIDQKGIEKFLEIYRARFAESVEKTTPPGTVTRLSGPVNEGFGQHKYIPIQQVLAQRNDNGLPDSAAIHGLECLASSMVNALMCLGLINPTLERQEFEARYTSIPPAGGPYDSRAAGPTSEDGVHLDATHNGTLRGLDGVNSLIPVRKPFRHLDALTKVFHDFQETDWAQLMGMGKSTASLELIDLRSTAKLDDVAPYIQPLEDRGGLHSTGTNTGCGIAFYTYRGVLYSDSQHFVTLDGIISDPPGASSLLCAENDRKSSNKSPAVIRIERGSPKRFDESVGATSITTYYKIKDGTFQVKDGELLAESDSVREEKVVGGNPASISTPPTRDAVFGRLLYTVVAKPA